MYQRKVFERYLTQMEERQLLRAVAQHAGPLARRDLAWMQLARQTGIRVGALAALTVEDSEIALRDGHLVLRPEIQKGGHGHTLYLTRKARAALRALLAVRRELGYAPRPEQPLIMSRNHRGMSVRSFQARMQHWCQIAGLDVAASPHWWRHTLAKRVLARTTARDPLSIVQAALGHSSPASTAVYTRPDREDLAKALEEAT